MCEKVFVKKRKTNLKMSYKIYFDFPYVQQRDIYNKQKVKNSSDRQRKYLLIF